MKQLTKEDYLAAISYPINREPVKYRRRYVCPSCGTKGRRSNRNRGPFVDCPECGVCFPAEIVKRNVTL